MKPSRLLFLCAALLGALTLQTASAGLLQERREARQLDDAGIRVQRRRGAAEAVWLKVARRRHP